MYNDEQLLTPAGYEKMARAYLKEAVRFDDSEEKALVSDILQTLHLLHGSLFALAGFLGTGALYSLTEQHIQKMHRLYGDNFDFKPAHFSRDKTKCFLNMLSLENYLINKLISLAGISKFSDQLFDIIKERTSLSSSLYKINGVISSYFL